MDVLYTFPTLYPGTSTVIVQKQPKTEGSIRTVYVPDTVAKKLGVLRELQSKWRLRSIKALHRPLLRRHRTFRPRYSF